MRHAELILAGERKFNDAIFEWWKYVDERVVRVHTATSKPPLAMQWKMSVHFTSFFFVFFFLYVRCLNGKTQIADAVERTHEAV